MLGVDQTDGDQAVNGLDGIDGVSTRDRDAGFGAQGFAAIENTTDRIDGQSVDRHADYRQREQGCAAHGVHVRQRVGRGDGSEVERIIDDGHEKIRGRDDRLAVIDAVDRRVVGCLDTDQKIAGDDSRRRSGDDVAQH